MKLDGPTFRHRNALITEESSICADSGAAASTTAAVTVRNRDRLIGSSCCLGSEDGERLQQPAFPLQSPAMPNAVVMPAPNQPLELREIPTPTLEPGAALLRTLFSEVCGTDVHLHHGKLDVPFPIVP